MAVSYTHLDVYKRQVPCHTQDISGNGKEQGDQDNGDQTLDRNIKQVIGARGMQPFEPVSQL